MTEDIYGISALPPGETGIVVADSAAAYWRGEPISAELFAIDDQAAVGFVIPGSADLELASLARQGRIAGRAEVDDDGIVVGIELFQSGGPCATAWCAGLAEKFVPWLAQPYFASFAFARVAAQLVGLTEPPRPAGAGQPLQLELIGEITEQKAKALVGQIRAAGTRSIVLSLDSAGGFVEPAMAIHEAAAAHRYHLETRIVGKAMSAAAIIALAGDLRTISPSGVVMFHEASLTNASQMRAPAMRAVATKMDKVTAGMIRIVANRTSKPLPKAQTWFAAETRFDAAAAVRAGICHALLHAKTNSVRPTEFSARRTGNGTAAAAAAWRIRMSARCGLLEATNR